MRNTHATRTWKKTPKKTRARRSIAPRTRKVPPSMRPTRARTRCPPAPTAFAIPALVPPPCLVPHHRRSLRRFQHPRPSRPRPGPVGRGSRRRRRRLAERNASPCGAEETRFFFVARPRSPSAAAACAACCRRTRRRSAALFRSRRALFFVERSHRYKTPTPPPPRRARRGAAPSARRRRAAEAPTASVQKTRTRIQVARFPRSHRVPSGRELGTRACASAPPVGPCRRAPGADASRRRTTRNTPRRRPGGADAEPARTSSSAFPQSRSPRCRVPERRMSRRRGARLFRRDASRNFSAVREATRSPSSVETPRRWLCPRTRLRGVSPRRAGARVASRIFCRTRRPFFSRGSTPTSCFLAEIFRSKSSHPVSRAKKSRSEDWSFRNPTGRRSHASHRTARAAGDVLVSEVRLTA